MFGLMLQYDWYALLKMGLPLIILFIGAVITLLNAALIEKEDEEEQQALLIPIISLVAVAIAFIVSWKHWLSGVSYTGMLEAQGAHGMLIFDRFTFFGWMIILFSTFITIILSIPYLRARGFCRPEYYGLILFSAFGMGCLISAGDLLIIFLGIETMSLAAYVLTGFLRTQAPSNEAALKYFLVGAFASAFLLMGIAFIFGSAGTTNLATLSSRAPEVLKGDGQHFYLFGMGMLLVGFGFKIAAVPFHAWAPDVYDGAPTPITTFMATAVKVAAFAALIRVGLEVFRASGDLLAQVIAVLSVVTMFVGNLAAIKQENIKRMLAYSSIAHAGYVLVAFPAMIKDPLGAAQAILFYLVAYILMTAGAFAVVVAMGSSKQEHTQINNLAALSRRRPFLAITLTLFLVSLLGIPPTVGFFGKYYLFLTAVKAGYVWLVILAVINSAISAYYYLRPIYVMYFTRADEALPAEPLSPAIVAVLVLTSMGVAYFGVFPQALLTIVGRTL